MKEVRKHKLKKEQTEKEYEGRHAGMKAEMGKMQDEMMLI